MSDQKELRCITYLVPSIPVELFELICHYWEEHTGLLSSLLYESRAEGPLKSHYDPFKVDKVDIAWMSSTAYMDLYLSKDSVMELLPVAPIINHRLSTDKPQLFTDVIYYHDLNNVVKSFSKLRGMRWAFPHENSLAGTAVTLRKLKEEGENASFFGSVTSCGSHLRAMEMVQCKQADAAAVDAHALKAFCNRSHHARRELEILESWGPLPPHATVVNARMTSDLKNKLTDLLLKMHLDRQWGPQLQELGVIRFAPNNHDVYLAEMSLREDVAGHNIKAMYY